MSRRNRKGAGKRSRVSGPGKDWLAADDYVRAYLAAHAAAAGRLDELLIDPRFLVAAEVNGLVGVLHQAQSMGARVSAEVYELASHTLGRVPFAERASYLELTARQQGADDLAKQIEKLDLGRRWSVPWARWQAASAHRIIGRHEGEVYAVAVGKLDGRPVIVSGGGSEYGVVRAWDLERGNLLYEPFYAHYAGGIACEVEAVAVGELKGRPVIVSGGGFPGTVRVWELARGTPLYKPLIVNDYGIGAVALGELDGQPVIVSSGQDNTVRVWDLERGTLLYEPLAGHDGGVNAVAVGELNGRPVIVSGGRDGTVRVWELGSGTPLYEPLAGHDGGVNAVAVSELKGRPLIVSGGWDGTVRVWELEGGTPLYEPLAGNDRGVNAVAAGELNGRPLIVSGGNDPTLRVWDLERGTPLYEPLAGHDRSIETVAVGELNGRPLIVSGGWDNTVRVWDLAHAKIPHASPSRDHRVNAVAVGELNGRPLIVSGGNDRTLRVLDPEFGTPEYAPLTGHDASVVAVALGELRGRPVIVSGDSEGAVRVWDLQHGNPVCAPLASGERSVNTVAVGQLDGQPVIVSGGGNDDNTVRAWDLVSGRLLYTPRVHQKKRRHEAAVGLPNRVLAVAVCELQGRQAIVSVDNEGTVQVWDLEHGTPHPTLHWSLDWASAVAICQLKGRLLIVSGGNYSSLEVWDLAHGTLPHPPRPLYSNVYSDGYAVTQVQAVAVGELEGRAVIVWSGDDGTMRLWDLPGGEPKLTIEAGLVDSIAIAPPSSIVIGTSKGLMVIKLPGGQQNPGESSQ